MCVICFATWSAFFIYQDKRFWTCDRSGRLVVYNQWCGYLVTALLLLIHKKYERRAMSREKNHTTELIVKVNVYPNLKNI